MRLPHMKCEFTQDWALAALELCGYRMQDAVTAYSQYAAAAYDM
jgi:hypothetical protein